jgi:predicted phage terminase large subunit-like protein
MIAIRNNNLTAAEKKAYDDWQETRKFVRNATENKIDFNETELQKANRIARLKTNFSAFCEYYLSHYMMEKGAIQPTKFGWFHHKAVRTILPDTLTVLEWSREHAKSVFADIMLPFYLYARGELDGMVIVSSTSEKATKLLGDIQAEFEENKLFIHDYGDLTATGNWQAGQFSTTDGMGFWCFGLGQNPRGIREGAKRPNYCVVDDADTEERCKNETRVDEALNWIRDSLFGCFGLKSGTRFIIAGNRIDKCSIVAKIVGDIEPEDPINPNINHIKVYALENPKTHEMDLDGVPAWIERYTIAELETRWAICGYRAKMREYFHQHIQEGTIFKDKWWIWGKVPPLTKILGIETYCDPSFTNTKYSDFKAVLSMGKGENGKIYLMDVWIQKASVKQMVLVFYDRWRKYGNKSKYRIEANMLQSLLLDEFNDMGNELGLHLPIRPDTRKKENKFLRIEAMTPMFERGNIIFDETLRKNANMQTFLGQLLGFPTANDDGPDCAAECLYWLQKISRSSSFVPRTGQYVRDNSRL